MYNPIIYTQIISNPTKYNPIIYNIVSNIQQILILLYNFPIQLYKLSGFYIMKRDGILMNFFAQDLLAHLFQVDTVQGQHANEKTSDWNNFNTDTNFWAACQSPYILDTFIDCVIYITFYWFSRGRFAAVRHKLR